MMPSPLFQSSTDLDLVAIADSYSDRNNITLHHGDSQTFLKTIPESAISLVVTSPPYNIGKSYERRQDIAGYLAEQEAVISDLWCGINAYKPSGREKVAQVPKEWNHRNGVLNS